MPVTSETLTGCIGPSSVPLGSLRSKPLQKTHGLVGTETRPAACGLSSIRCEHKSRSKKDGLTSKGFKNVIEGWPPALGTIGTGDRAFESGTELLEIDHRIEAFEVIALSGQVLQPLVEISVHPESFMSLG
jgi:hypothetical protein